MTDYYLITLFHDTLQLLSQTIMDYISVLFAFLIAGYFVSDKLKPSMIAIIIILFTGIAGSQMTNMFFLQHDMSVLATQMQFRVIKGDFALPDLMMTRDPGSFYNLTVGMAAIGSYIGTLVFFFHHRRADLEKT